MVTKTQLIDRTTALVKGGLLVIADSQKAGTATFWAAGRRFAVWAGLDGVDLWKVPLIVATEPDGEGKPVVGFAGKRAEPDGPVRDRAVAAARAVRAYLMTGGAINIPDPPAKAGVVPNAVDTEPEPAPAPKRGRGRPRKSP